ncbi:MAG TPA: hypothetical protein VEJ18_21845, partial [Planctomycetota bacterium]|nr:hypothetical protein [Planctomycetota bacterium]
MARSTWTEIDLDGKRIGSIRLRPGGVSYQFRYRDQGKRFDVTLHGVTDKAEAIKAARERWKSRGTTPPRLPTIAPANGSPRLWSAVRRYLRNYRLENQPSSYSRLRPALRTFCTHLGGMGIDPRTITTEHLEEYRNLRARQAGNQEANGDLTRALAFCRWMQSRKLVPMTEPLKVSKLTVDNETKPSPSPIVVQNLIKAVQGHWLADWVTLAANLGTRPQELLHVRRCDFHRPKRLLSIEGWQRDGYIWRTKTRQKRRLALNEAAFTVLDR